MAGNVIDRDWREMVKFEREAKEIIENTETLLEKIKGTAEAFRGDLDAPSLKIIDELNEVIGRYERQLKKYTETAERIGSDGRLLKERRGE